MCRQSLKNTNRPFVWSEPAGNFEGLSLDFSNACYFVIVVFIWVVESWFVCLSLWCFKLDTKDHAQQGKA